MISERKARQSAEDRMIIRKHDSKQKDRLTAVLAYCGIRPKKLEDNQFLGFQSKIAKNFNSELIRKIRKKRYREEYLRFGKEWRKAHPEADRLYSKKYRSTPEGLSKVRAASHRRRIRLQKLSVDDLTSEEIQEILAMAKRCAICGKRFLKKDKKTIDHILAISKGGRHSILNIQVAHLKCNLRKSAKHYTEFTKGQFLMFLGKNGKNITGGENV